MPKQKKIYSHEICMTQSYNEGSGDHVYEVKKEQFECEYSEEWTQDSDDPIKDYVENAIENMSDESFSEELDSHAKKFSVPPMLKDIIANTYRDMKNSGWDL